MNIGDENTDSSGEESSFDIKSIIPKIFRIWPYILISVLFFLLGSYILTRTSIPQYKVSGLFYIKDKDSKFSLFDAPSVEGPAKIGIVNEIVILKSKPIANITLNQLNFDVEYYEKGTFLIKELYGNTPVLVEIDWKSPQVIDGLISLKWEKNDKFKIEFQDESYKKYLPDGSNADLKILPEILEYPFGEWIETNYLKIRVTNTSLEQEGELFVKFRDHKSLINEYSSKLNVQSIEREGSILELSLTSSSINKGEVYINALMESYLRIELEDKNAIASNTVRFIDSQVAGVSDSLKIFENQLQTFRSSNKIYDLNSESASVFDQLTEYEATLRQEEFKRSYYKNLAGYLVRENYQDLVVPSGIGIEDPILNSLISNLMELQVEKSRQLATMTELAPQVQGTINKIKDLNLSIQEILKNVDQNSALLIQDLKNRISDIESSFRDLPATQQNLIRIERQFTLNENIYTFLMEKRAEAAISKASNSSENKIIEPAEGGLLVGPIPIRNYSIGFFLGLFAPVLFVFIRELTRTKIEDISYLERNLKIPVLSTILFNKSKSNLVVFEQGKSGLAEGFRSLRANIRFLRPMDQQLTMMITSTISAEGKTFCAMNLASVYSLTGKRTILVGCDMRKPKIFQDFEVSNDIGLSSILSGQTKDLSKAISKTKYENLDLLVSGPNPPNPAELLFTKRFEDLILELKQLYDVVILDTPPIGLVSETLDLLTHVDITLFVFRQNYSQRSFVDALNGLKQNKDLKNIYSIFNGVDGSKGTYGYGYSYGYGYGYYDDDKKK